MMELYEYTNDLIQKTFEKKSSEISQFISMSKKECICMGDGLMCMPMASKELIEDGFKISFILDDKKGGMGKYSCGFELISRTDERIPPKPYYICTTRRVKEAYESLTTEGEDMIGGFISYAQYLACKHFGEYIDVRDNYLSDDKSKLVFNMALYALLTDYYNNELIYERDQYFAIREFDLWQNESFVDVGASFGDFLDRLLEHSIGRFVSYTAFEPGERQFEALVKRAKRIKEEWAIDSERIRLEKKGIGGKTHSSSQSEIACGYVGGGFFREDSDGSSIEVTSIDDYFQNEKITFLKADIEGMEMEMLNGAENIIRTQKPKIAICAYHLPCDIYTLAVKIKKINPDYKLSLRCHAKNYEEIVLYAY